MRRVSLLSVLPLAAAMAVPTFAQSHGPLVLVVAKGDDTVHYIDADSGKEVGKVAEGGTTGHELAISADNKYAWLPIYSNVLLGHPGSNGQNMIKIDIAAQKVVGNVDFGHGVRPHMVLYGPKDGLLYVSTELDNTITIVDPKEMKVIGTIPTGKTQSHMFSITPDNKWIFTTNVESGTVSVLDIKKRSLVKIIDVAPIVQRDSMSKDGKWFFVSDQKQFRTAVISTKTLTIDHWIDLPNFGYGQGMYHDGKTLLIVDPLIGKVSVVNLKTLKVEHIIDVPEHPQNITTTPDDKFAFVTSDKTGTVSKLDLTTYKLVWTTPGMPSADGLAYVPAQ